MKRISLVDFVLFSVASFFLLIGSYPDVFMKDYSLTASGILIAGVLPLVLGLVLLVLWSSFWSGRKDLLQNYFLVLLS
ncbi:MAG: hypothetical protein WCS91_04080 [Bacilli bacterium]